jgi:hypothetical protein
VSLELRRAEEKGKALGERKGGRGRGLAWWRVEEEGGGPGGAWCGRRSGGPTDVKRAVTAEAASGRRGRGPPRMGVLGGAVVARGPLLLWAQPTRTVAFSIYSKEIQKEAT